MEIFFFLFAFFANITDYQSIYWGRMMSTELFFELFLEELKSLPELSHYYKFLSSEKDFEFRKNYFIQRLDYVYEQVKEHQVQYGKDLSIWDCGCGYGTTCLFLAMNGIQTYGSTLEFYFPFIPQRKAYWSAHGNASLFTAGYEDIFENQPAENTVDIIILQDTLHHLEPIHEAIDIFRRVLKPKGILIGIEENGNNIIQNLKLYKQRGNRRIITFWDEKLQKNITMGNENIRGLKAWDAIFKTAAMSIDAGKTQFVRLFPPFLYSNKSAKEVAQIEKSWANKFLRQYFFFGINFVAQKA
nr:class I SAM-dependent methyltransferase [Chitinophagaceae bacterium]